MSKYEVTVPVTVTVTDDGGLRVTGFAFNEYGGFFSEAEEAAGVWDADQEVWGHDDAQEAIAEVAQRFVQRRFENEDDKPFNKRR